MPPQAKPPRCRLAPRCHCKDPDDGRVFCGRRRPVHYPHESNAHGPYTIRGRWQLNIDPGQCENVLIGPYLRRSRGDSHDRSPIDTCPGAEFTIPMHGLAASDTNATPHRLSLARVMRPPRKRRRGWHYRCVAGRPFRSGSSPGRPGSAGILARRVPGTHGIAVATPTSRTTTPTRSGPSGGTGIPGTSWPPGSAGGGWRKYMHLYKI